MKLQTKLYRRVASLHREQPAAAGSRHGWRNLILPGEWLRALKFADEEGSALVEFALILPMMLLLTTGVLVFGVAMNNYLQLTNAVSVGARTLAINGGITTDPCATASSAIIAAAPGLTSSKLTFSYSLGGHSQSGPSCSSSSVESGAAAELASGTTVTVTAQYPLNLSVFGNKYSATNAVLQATSSELVQ